MSQTNLKPLSGLGEDFEAPPSLDAAGVETGLEA
jgi:hypothetical protein